MRQRPSTDMRAHRGSVFVLALLVLSATHHARAGSVKSVGGASPVCPAGFQLAANSSVCAQRLEANATISYAEAQLSCYETYAQLAEPFVTDVASCTASSPCWLGGRCHIHRHAVEDHGPLLWLPKHTHVEGDQDHVTCHSEAALSNGLDTPDVSKRGNWVYGPLTPELVSKHGGAFAIATWPPLRNWQPSPLCTIHRVHGVDGWSLAPRHLQP